MNIHDDPADVTGSREGIKPRYPVGGEMGEFPTTEQIMGADVLSIARWYRFLRARTPLEAAMVNLVARRLNEMGGMTPELSKEIGWGDIGRL